MLDALRGLLEDEETLAALELLQQATPSPERDAGMRLLLAHVEEAAVTPTALENWFLARVEPGPQAAGDWADALDELALRSDAAGMPALDRGCDPYSGDAVERLWVLAGGADRGLWMEAAREQGCTWTDGDLSEGVVVADVVSGVGQVVALLRAPSDADAPAGWWRVEWALR